MRSRLAAVSLVAALLCRPAVGGAATTLYLTGDPEAPLVNGRTFLFTTPSPNVTVTPSAEDHGLFVDARDDDYIYFRVLFLPPPGTQFVPGGYQGVAQRYPNDHDPGVRVDGSNYYVPVGATLTVYDAAYDPGGQLVRFVASFSQTTHPAAPPLTGAIRMNAGDDDCVGADDGTACDDADACTPSVCEAGVCVAGQRAGCGPAPDQCHDAPVCSPLDGSCSVPGVRESLPCDDGDACTRYEICRGGECGSSAFVEYCDGWTDCTYRQCDATAGCQYPSIPGTCDTPGVASTLAFVRGTGFPYEPDFTVLSVPPERPGVGFYSFSTEIAVTISHMGPTLGYYLNLGFFAADGQPLVPGTYEGAVDSSSPPPGRPALVGFMLPCGVPETRRFVVHEVTHDVHADVDEVVGFAVDFTSRCPEDGTELRGLVRFRTGDAGCKHAVDGTPCDDLNTCTGTSACRDGLCVGGDPVVCPARDGCHEPPICDPSSGACLEGATLADGTACHDAIRCVPDGECLAGVCTSPRVPCDDFDVCTEDRCDGNDGCEHVPLDGTCWRLQGTATLTATAYGATCSCSVRAKPTPLALHADGTFSRPGGLLRCESGETTLVPAEVGTATPGKRGRLILSTTNLDDLLAAIGRCGTYVDSFKQRGWVKVDASRGRLRGTTVERAKGAGSPVRLTTTIRFRGRPTTEGTVAGSSIPTARCTRSLIDCLTDKLSD
jgi:hypothetical protein